MMYKVAAFFCFACFIVFLSGWSTYNLQSDNLYQLQGKAQGTTYTIKYIAKRQVIKSSELDSIFLAFDHSLSRYQNSSLLSDLNKAKKHSKIDHHLQQVLQEAIKFQEITMGCFDYRLLPFRRLWGFESTANVKEPNDQMIKRKLQKISFNNIIINDLTVVKSCKKLEIDLDGIAQGYCVDELAQFLSAKEIDNYVVELGGEIFVAGKDLNNENWKIGITDAMYKDDKYAVVTLAKEGRYAVTTSGSLQQYRKIGDKVVSHVIDPRTGYPVQNGVIAVTVLAEHAVEADALDNAFMVMGVKETFEWLKKYPKVGVFMTYIDENGEKADTANDYFKQYIVIEGKN